MSEGRSDVPTNENEGQAGDQHSLQKSGEERVADGVGETLIDIAGVEDNQDRSGLLGIAMKRQRVSVERKTADIQIVGRTSIEFVGACCEVGTLFEIFGVVGSDCEDFAGAIVNHHAQQVFALRDLGNDALKIFVCRTTRRCLDAFLKSFRQGGSAMREIVAQVAPLGAVLIAGVEKGHQGHTKSERQNQFECGTHAASTGGKEVSLYQSECADHAELPWCSAGSPRQENYGTKKMHPCGCP